MKYALLDTDFISKTYTIQDYHSKHLIDLIIELENYKFYCHEQIKIELLKNNQMDHEWINCKISSSMIQCYTDKQILSELFAYYSHSCCIVYSSYLKKHVKYIL